METEKKRFQNAMDEKVDILPFDSAFRGKGCRLDFRRSLRSRLCKSTRRDFLGGERGLIFRTAAGNRA